MDETTPVFAPARRGLGWQAVLATALLTFVVGAVVVGWLVRQHPGWFGIQSAPSTASVAQAVKTATGETPVVIVPGGGPPAALPAVDLNALSTREAALSARLTDLETRTAAVGGDAAAASGYATRAEGMLVAFAARRAIDRGVGLGYLEEQLRDRFGGVQPRAVGIVITGARSPVTLADLRGGLDAVAPSLVSGGDVGWGTRFRRELGNLVVVHREDAPSPLPADRLARARRLVDAGQIEAAYAEVAQMPGVSDAQGWVQAARRYVAVRRALDTIESAAIAGPPTPQPILPPLPTPTATSPLAAPATR